MVGPTTAFVLRRREAASKGAPQHGGGASRRSTGPQTERLAPLADRTDDARTDAMSAAAIEKVVETDDEGSPMSDEQLTRAEMDSRPRNRSSWSSTKMSWYDSNPGEAAIRVHDVFRYGAFPHISQKQF